MKLQYSKLSSRAKSLLKKRGCGPGRSWLFIPQFIFRASCQQHDFYYARGGNLFDKIEADTMFYAFMVKDVADSDASFFKKIFYVKMATLYFLVISIIGHLYFKYGKYKTEQEVLEILK